jgi:carbamoyltransferase
MPAENVCLGLHIGHDRGITIAREGQIAFHTAVERLDRRKHSDSPDLPIPQIRHVLERIGIETSTISAVCVTYHAVEASRIAPTLESDFKQAFPDFTGTFLAIDHHLAHALAAVACSTFEEAIVFVADGAGDSRLWGSQAESLFYVSREHFYLLEERLQHRPLATVYRPEFFLPAFFAVGQHNDQISLGLKYEQITYLCGFKPGQAGQTMALASYGAPLFDIQPLVPSNFGFSLRYIDLLDRFDQIARERGVTLRQLAASDRADLASTAQHFLEHAVMNLVDYTIATYAPKNLCFAGGLFLNCPANRLIVDRHSDRELFFLPVCDDEGQSIGAAAYAYWRTSGTLPAVGRDFPYLGFAYSTDECIAAMRAADLTFESYNDEQLSQRLAALIANGKICAIARGRSEAGPRALGHRSILGDPRSGTTKERLDAGIKRRAEFRPYAPMVHASRANVYFEMALPSPYMLLTAQVRPDFRALLPAITHVDGTARVQTVHAERTPFLADVLLRFEAEVGVAVLLNTSFNDEREPIVETPADAIRTYLSTDLDAVVLGNLLHVKPGS